MHVWDLGTSGILCQHPAPKIPEEEDTLAEDEEEYSMGAISDLSFSQDGALLATSLRSYVRVYDTRTFIPLPTPVNG